MILLLKLQQTTCAEEENIYLANNWHNLQSVHFSVCLLRHCTADTDREAGTSATQTLPFNDRSQQGCTGQAFFIIQVFVGHSV